MKGRAETLSLFRDRDFRRFLVSVLAERQKSNPRYSLRAFARDLGVRPQRLSDVLKGQYGLSLQAARQIAKKLRLQADESAYFCDLVASQHARSESERRHAKARLASYQEQLALRSLDDDKLQYFATWRNPVILELITAHDGKIELELLARALNVSMATVTQDLENLISLGALRKKGKKFERVPNFEKVSARRSVPTEVIRGFHRQIMNQAADALDSQEVKERKYLSTVFTIDVAKLESARTRLQEMHDEFLKEFHVHKSKAIYAVAVQFFKAANEVPNH